jgi:hypothetical protein
MGVLGVGRERSVRRPVLVSDGGFWGGEGEAGEATSDRCQSVTGFLGWGGRGRWSNERPVSVCDGVGPPRFPHPSGVQTRTWSPQNIAVVRRERMTVGLHLSPTTLEADIKTFPSPPHYRKNWRLYRGACFRKFPKLSRTKVQNVKTGVLSFFTPVG